jgi:hypothetical protein
MPLILLLLFVSTLAAQTGPPDLTDCYVTSTKAGSVGDRSLSVKCTLTGGTAGDYDDYDFDVQYGTDSTLTTWRRYPVGEPLGEGDDGAARWTRIQDLEPESTVYLRPRVTNSAGTFTPVGTCPATCTNCDSGDDAIFGDNGSGGSGINCVSGEIWRVTMATLDSGAPIEPAAPSHTMSADIPAADNTHVIDGTCSNWSTQLTAARAAANASGTVERIEIPPGVRCPCFNLTALTQGRVQVTTGADPETLPGEGTMVHAGYRDRLGLITHDPSAPEDWGDTCIGTSGTATGYDLFNLRLTIPPGAAVEDYPSPRGSQLILLGQDHNTIRFDRLMIDFPEGWNFGSVWNIANAIDISITNNWVRRELDDDGSDTFTVYMGGAEDVQIINNNFMIDPFVFADTAGRQTGNPLTLKGNIIHAADRYSPQHPDYGGTHQFFTYCVELKSCATCAITGNVFKGCRAGDFNNNQATLAITGVNQQDSHILIYGNTFKQTDSVATFSDNNVPGPYRPIYPSERILVEHNLAFGLSKEYCNTSGCTTGAFWSQWSPQEDTIIQRNTYHIKSGSRPMILWMTRRGQGHLNENNIYTFTDGGSSNRGVRRLIGSTELPDDTEETGSAAFDQVFISGTTADSLSAFQDNVIIPGIENSGTSADSKLDSVLDSETISCAEAIAHATLTTFTGLECVGSASECADGTCPDSFADRLNLAFQTGTWRPISPTYDGKGADIDILEREQGRIRSVDVTPTHNAVTITFAAPSTVGLTVALAPYDSGYDGSFDDEGTIVEQTDASTATAQTVTFDSGTTGALTPETKYAYRIGSDTKTSYVKERFGTFTTAGAP